VKEQGTSQRVGNASGQDCMRLAVPFFRSCVAAAHIVLFTVSQCHWLMLRPRAGIYVIHGCQPPVLSRPLSCYCLTCWLRSVRFLGGLQLVSVPNQAAAARRSGKGDRTSPALHLKRASVTSDVI
jgi:hypothetical protein